jgi:hypothetical protein
MDVMTTIGRIAATATALLSALSAAAVELKVSREALQQQLFDAPNGRYYLKGSATSGCSVYAEDPEVRSKKTALWFD